MSHRNFSKFLFAGLSLVSLGTSIFVACSDKELPFGEDTSVGDTSVGDGDTAANPLFDGSTNLPDGSTLLPDGAIALPDGGVLTAREACVRMQVAKCARALQCEKGNPSAWPEVVDPLLTLYASPEPRLEECVKRYLSRCEFYLLPGSSIPLQQLLQCEAARSAQSCEELTAPHPIGYDIDENGNTFDRYNTPAACRFFGNRTPGDKCIANSQCASGTCAPPTISDGGTCGAQCLAPLPRGASCLDRNVRTPACSVGLECIDNPDGGPSVICETPNVPKPGFDEGSPCTVATYLKGERTGVNDLMSWNADGTRMAYRMHTDYLHQLYLNNDLAEGRYVALGETLDLAAVDVPMFVVGTERPEHRGPVNVIRMQEERKENLDDIPLKRRLSRMTMEDKVNMALSGTREERMALAMA